MAINKALSEFVSDLSVPVLCGRHARELISLRPFSDAESDTPRVGGLRVSKTLLLLLFVVGPQCLICAREV